MSNIVQIRPEVGRAEPPLFLWSEVDPRAAPKERYLVDRIVPAQGASLVVGPPKTGKSQLMGHLVASFVARRPVFGSHEIDPDFAERGRVLWIMAEENRYKPRARVEANLRGFGWTDAEILDLELDNRLVVSARDPDPGAAWQDSVFSFERHRTWLLDAARDFDLVILDSLRPAHALDENSSQAMKPVTDVMRALACYTSFVVLHHTGHESLEYRRHGADRARGSSDLDAARDTAIVFEHGRFGGPVALGIYHRDDASLQVGLVTHADRDKKVAEWNAVCEGTAAEVKEVLRQTDFLPMIQNASRVEELPSMTVAKTHFGKDYKETVRKLVNRGIVKAIRRKSPGPGAPSIALMLPGQFPDVDIVNLEER